MNPQALAHFIALLKDRTGIDLSADKDYLVRSRLGPIAGTVGLPTADALLEAIQARPTAQLVDAALDAMTTNETYFFRDQTPFEQLRRFLLEPTRKSARRVRIWSAACSSGQEPYSIAMLWDEIAHHLPGVSLEIVATDLSAACLAKAKAGVYSAFEVQRGLAVQKLMKHFEQVGPNWKVKPALAASVAFHRHNLLESADRFGRFEVIFCRNVLIYFDRPTRSRILDGLARQLAVGGCLFLGASETVLGLTGALKPSAQAPGLYVKGDTEPAPSPLRAQGGDWRGVHDRGQG